MNLIYGAVTQAGDGLLFHERASDSAPRAPRISFQFDGRLAARLQPFVGKEVVLGLRAENIHFKEWDEADSEAPTVQGIVQLVQPLGWETLAHAATAAHLLAARLKPEQRIQPQQNAAFTLDLSSARFFDPANGVAIT
jgi:multiple sugar transport system ATP-binding protein